MDSPCFTCKFANKFIKVEDIDCVVCEELGLNTVCPKDVICQFYSVSNIRKD